MIHQIVKQKKIKVLNEITLDSSFSLTKLTIFGDESNCECLNTLFQIHKYHKYIDTIMRYRQHQNRYSCGIKVIPRVSFTKVLVRIIWGAKYRISSYKQSFDVSPTSTCCNTHSSAFFGEGFFKCIGLVCTQHQNLPVFNFLYFATFLVDGRNENESIWATSVLVLRVR